MHAHILTKRSLAKGENRTYKNAVLIAMPVRGAEMALKWRATLLNTQDNGGSQ